MTRVVALLAAVARRARARRRAATAVLNRAPPTRRPWCSTSRRTPSTPASTRRSPSGEYEREGIELEVREPSASTDAPKLLEAGRADFAILDIHDLAIARERGFDVVGVAAIVQRPLAAVIAARPRAPSAPRPTSRAARSASPGCPPTTRCSTRCSRPAAPTPQAVERVTIGFDSVAALSAGRLDAATAFWNAEGVALRRLGVPTREFRVDDFGAPPLPGAGARDLGRDARRAARAGRGDASPRPGAATPTVVDDPERRARRPARRGAGARPRRAAAPSSTRCWTAGAIGSGVGLDRGRARRVGALGRRGTGSSRAARRRAPRLRLRSGARLGALRPQAVAPRGRCSDEGGAWLRPCVFSDFEDKTEAIPVRSRMLVPAARPAGCSGSPSV